MADRRARLAVSLIFFLNGASFCAILPRYPELKAHLHLTNGAFGLAVGVGPVGGLIAGLAAAWLMRRFGSALVSVALQVFASTVHLLIYTSGSWLWFAGALFVAAAGDSITDIAMNAHGMRVERRYRRSIMNSYHGWWSLGAVAGGLLGSLCAQLHVPLWAQGVGGLIVFGALAIWSFRWLLPGHDATERTSEPALAGVAPGSAQDVEVVTESGKARPSAPMLTMRAFGLLVCLGLLLVFSGATEDAGNTWGALFMTSTFAAGPFVAGLAFVCLQGAQTIGRFIGDGVVNRLGDRLTARIGAVVAGVGMSLALLFPSVPMALVSFAMAGLGIATLFPAAYRAADEMDGARHGVGITLVGWLARIGFFASPPVIGALADALSLQRALWLVPLYAVGILVFAGALSGRTTAADSVSATSNSARP